MESLQDRVELIEERRSRVAGRAVFIKTTKKEEAAQPKARCALRGGGGGGEPVPVGGPGAAAPVAWLPAAAGPAAPRSWLAEPLEAVPAGCVPQAVTRPWLVAVNGGGSTKSPGVGPGKPAAEAVRGAQGSTA